MAKQPACVLAIATANPPFCVKQSDYVRYYYEVTGKWADKEIDQKFQSICNGTRISERYFYTTKEMLESNPELVWPGLGIKMEVATRGVSSLAVEAAERAIQAWGRDKSEISHVVFATVSGVKMPGPDHSLVKLLGLRSNVKRLMLYQQACTAGVTTMRIAKDIAENNLGSRVLVVCSVVLSSSLFNHDSFKAGEFDKVVISSLFGDGAAAIIVGATPVQSVERPLYYMHATCEVLVPQSLHMAKVSPSEQGADVALHKELPYVIATNIEHVLKITLGSCHGLPSCISYDQLFWVLHPGGPKIVSMVEAKLGLPKLEASWDVLDKFGNMSGASVFFVLERLVTLSRDKASKTTGDGLEWGVLVGFGPGVTIETMVLQSCPL